MGVSSLAVNKGKCNTNCPSKKHDVRNCDNGFSESVIQNVVASKQKLESAVGVEMDLFSSGA